MEPIKNNLEFYIILKNKDIPNKIKKVVKINDCL